MAAQEYLNKIRYNNLLELKGMVRLSERDEDIIRELLKGESQVALARKYGISKSRITPIIWGYVQRCQRYNHLWYFEDMEPMDFNEFLKYKGKRKDVINKIKIQRGIN